MGEYVLAHRKWMETVAVLRLGDGAGCRNGGGNGSSGRLDPVAIHWPDFRCPSGVARPRHGSVNRKYH